MPQLDTANLGILLARRPASKEAAWGIALARAAIGQGHGVELFLMGEGAELVSAAETTELSELGVRVFVCTRSVTERDLPLDLDHIDYAGQFQLGRMVDRVDRFVSFT